MQRWNCLMSNLMLHYISRKKIVSSYGVGEIRAPTFLIANNPLPCQTLYERVTRRLSFVMTIFKLHALEPDGPGMTIISPINVNAMRFRFMETDYGSYVVEMK